MDLDDGVLLEGDELLADGPLLEAPEANQPATIVIPKRGKVISEAGTVKIAVMRPCISRGKRIRGLSPIYTPRMLAENAHVVKGWPMFMGHLPPELMEKLHAMGRSPLDLGGRLVNSWFDSEFSLPDDSEYGYRQGALMAEAIPYEAAEKIIERDPEGLHTSINAYPTAARVGTAPWDAKTRGAIIEGLRPKPIGSVDWVIRGGAGGRVLTESEQRVITILEACYGSAQMDPRDFQNMTPEQLREHLEQHAPHLLPALRESQAAPGSGGQVQVPAAPAAAAATPPASDAAAGGEGRALTRQELAEALAEHERNVTRQIEERDTQAQDRAEEIVAERETLRGRQLRAHELIEEADLGPKWKADLKARYTLLPSGAPPALLAEAEVEDGVTTKTPDEVFEARVEADIAHTLDLVREAQGGPVVAGQGGPGADGRTGTPSGPDPLAEFLMESGTPKPEGEGKDATDALAEALID